MTVAKKPSVFEVSVKSTVQHKIEDKVLERHILRIRYPGVCKPGFPNIRTSDKEETVRRQGSKPPGEWIWENLSLQKLKFWEFKAAQECIFENPSLRRLQFSKMHMTGGLDDRKSKSPQATIAAVRYHRVC